MLNSNTETGGKKKVKMVFPNQLPSCFVESNPEDTPSFALVNKRKFPLVLCFFSLNAATVVLAYIILFSFLFFFFCFFSLL